MASGPVNQALLESFYQNAGEVYDDTKTEGALQVIVNQVNDNWTDYAVVKTVLNSVTPGSSGSEYVKSAPIAGVTGTTVHEQLTNIEQQVQAVVGGAIPTGSVTYDKLNPVPTTVNAPNTLPVRNANNQIEVGAPTAPGHAATKSYVDATLSLIGTYTGNGAATRDILLPFTPSAVIVLKISNNPITSFDSGLAVTGSPVTYSATVTIGVGVNLFTIGAATNKGTNVNGDIYNYIAFR